MPRRIDRSALLRDPDDAGDQTPEITPGVQQANEYRPNTHRRAGIIKRNLEAHLSNAKSARGIVGQDGVFDPVMFSHGPLDVTQDDRKTYGIGDDRQEMWVHSDAAAKALKDPITLATTRQMFGGDMQIATTEGDEPVTVDDLVLVHVPRGLYEKMANRQEKHQQAIDYGNRAVNGLDGLEGVRNEHETPEERRASIMAAKKRMAIDNPLCGTRSETFKMPLAVAERMRSEASIQREEEKHRSMGRAQETPRGQDPHQPRAGKVHAIGVGFDKDGKVVR